MAINLFARGDVRSTFPILRQILMCESCSWLHVAEESAGKLHRKNAITKLNTFFAQR